MSVQDFFKQYPLAQSLWQVGDDLFFHAYESSARQHAQRTGKACKLVLRESLDTKKEK